MHDSLDGCLGDASRARIGHFLSSIAATIPSFRARVKRDVFRGDKKLKWRNGFAEIVVDGVPVSLYACGG
jgi:hypothetical protein